jgi:hypothetical protein
MRINLASSKDGVASLLEQANLLGKDSEGEIGSRRRMTEAENTCGMVQFQWALVYFSSSDCL